MGSLREFAAFVYEDADFERIPGDLPVYQQYQDTFQASGHGAIVIQNIAQKPAEGERHWVEFWLGPNFGGVAITYGQVRGYTRGSTAEKVGPMEWQFRDSKANEPFDFYYPFPSLVAPAT